MMDDKPLDHIAVAPPVPDDVTPPSSEDKSATAEVRDAHDAEHHAELADDPSHEDAKLEVGLDESFPSSDPPATSTPGSGEPVASSGFDEEAEKKLAETR